MRTFLGWWRRRVMAKMMLRSLIILSLSILLVEYVSYLKSSQQIRKLTEERQHSLTVLYAERFDHIMRRIEDDLQSVSDLPSLRDFFLNRRYELMDEARQNLDNAAEFLKRLHKREPAYALMQVTDSRSHNLVTMLEGRIDFGPDSNMYQKLYGEELSKVGLLQGWALRFQRPLINQGEEFGKVTLFYDLESLIGPLSRERLFRTGHLALYDSRHAIIYDPNHKTGTKLADRMPELSDMLDAHWESRSRVLNMGTAEYLVNASSMTERDWHITAIVPKSEMMAGLNRTRDFVIMLIVINIIIEVVFIFLFTRNLIINPINRLLEGTRAVARHNYHFRVEMNNEDELGQLAESFNFMTASLGQTIRDLHEGQEHNKQLNGELAEKVRQLEAQIQDRKRAEEELRKSEARLASILDNTNSVINLKDTQGRYITINRQFEKLFKVTRSSVIGKTDHDLFPFALARIFRENDRKVLDTGRLIEFEEQAPHEDGLHTYISVKFVLHDSAGRIYAVCGISTDITERKKAEEENRRLRNHLQKIIDSMQSAMVGIDPAESITQWNREAGELTGFGPSEALHAPFTRVLPQLAGLTDDVRGALMDGKPRKHSKVHLQFGKRSGFYDFAVFPLVGNTLEGAVIRLDEVSQRVKMEEIMIQSEKMLSVGGLAAGMAHEINNPLAGIMQNAQVLGNRLTSDMPRNVRVAEECGANMGAIRAYIEKRGINEMLAAIAESGKRASRIVDNMLSFSRKSESRFSPHNLAELLDQTVELVSNDYDLEHDYDFRHFRIQREYDPSVTVVPCEASKIQQVFLNILKNGAQAMALERVRNPCFILRIKRLDTMAKIQFRDNGPGMQEDVRKRIFEPFYTTKPVGVGTGLGLSVSYFIITENHGGSITVESEIGQGSCFTILLPLERTRA